MRVESHWASPSVPTYRKDAEDKEQQAGAGAQLCALSPGWRLLKSGSIILSPPPQVSGGSVLLVAHSPSHGLVPVCLPVSDAPVPCLVIHLFNHWGPPSLPKTKSRVLSGKQSFTGWGYFSHLICGQPFTVYKTRPSLLTDTYYSKGPGNRYPHIQEGTERSLLQLSPPQRDPDLLRNNS